jgi:2,3,4,5-tetrahydropyridine-2-carboxylate N-succinyltransferase
MKVIIEKAWEDRSLLQSQDVKDVIHCVIDHLDQGKIRVAEPIERDLSSHAFSIIAFIL